MADVLLTDLIIASALKAAITLKFFCSILPLLEVDLSFGYKAKFEQSRLGSRWLLRTQKYFSWKGGPKQNLKPTPCKRRLSNAKKFGMQH